MKLGNIIPKRSRDILHTWNHKNWANISWDMKLLQKAHKKCTAVGMGLLISQKCRSDVFSWEPCKPWLHFRPNAQWIFLVPVLCSFEWITLPWKVTLSPTTIPSFFEITVLISNFLAHVRLVVINAQPKGDITRKIKNQGSVVSHVVYVCPYHTFERRDLLCNRYLLFLRLNLWIISHCNSKILQGKMKSTDCTLKVWPDLGYYRTHVCRNTVRLTWRGNC
jgi:hypothetical protein